MTRHVGRSWDGPGHLEALCPCPLAPCGLVDVDNVDDKCKQHPPMRCKTMRTGHLAEDCPGTGRAVVVALGRVEVARQRIIDAACMEPEGFVNASIFDAVDDFQAAVAHMCAEQIREETKYAKAMGVLEPDKFRPCRDAADQIDPEESES
ncbi:hypothetical protein HEK616_40710 [Streptomyces nigrescens]|uniref:Uncharacterized protein n=1 Tax=Streptomyces nigrescens TaxID=1920 RepID=A0ABM7ZW42_STRNI|nr:hypothetical protein [Streptomyces nigrescens]BDM70584.1 hypothetical protein HEK616_40710 [Streptomyces nigrescens]